MSTYIRDELAELRAEPNYTYVAEGALATYGPLAIDRARLVSERIDDLLA